MQASSSLAANLNAVGLLARRRETRQHVAPPTRHEQQLALYRRGSKWLGTTAITWPIWALTGAPTGLPSVIANHHHVVVSAGMWPAFLMIGGLADIAKRARKLYAEPLIQAAAADAEAE